MKMQKRTFRIGELAKHLGEERFVVRFWEKEFKVKTKRSYGGQRFYTEEDLSFFKKIKDLLKNKGFTIIGAKQALKEDQAKKTIEKTNKFSDHEVKTLKQEKNLLEKKVLILQQQLIKLRELL